MGKNLYNIVIQKLPAGKIVFNLSEDVHRLYPSDDTEIQITLATTAVTQPPIVATKQQDFTSFCKLYTTATAISSIINGWDTSTGTNFTKMFDAFTSSNSGWSNVEEILTPFDFSNATNLSAAFDLLTNLREIRFDGKLSATIAFVTSELSDDSYLSLLNVLDDVSVGVIYVPGDAANYLHSGLYVKKDDDIWIACNSKDEGATQYQAAVESIGTQGFWQIDVI